ncbi:MAG: serine/threonine protein kinase [Deltaproteobacteria bacterium]|nr:serine/threonine protein kinase [Deltaproteobacteria bacterium]
MSTENPQIYGKDPFPPGTVLEEKFRLEKVLGRGAMGVVYLGYDVFLERNVAIKVLKGRSMASHEAVERFRREAVTMATINHLNIVQIFSFGEKEGYYYFVMEYIPGQTLATFIDDFYRASDFVPLDVAIGLISQICSGLGAVHKRGIAHRDVKPANVLISRDNYHVALTDFGLTSLSETGKDKFVEGTPLYLAPERIKSEVIKPDDLPASDIYSVGCIFFELLTGRPPFECDNIVELLGMHIHEPIPRVTLERPDIPIYIDEIITKAMAKKISDRYSSCEELKQELLSKRMPQVSSRFVRPFAVLFDDGNRAKELGDYLRREIPRLNIHEYQDQNEALAVCQKEKPDVALITFREDDQFSALELASMLSNSSVPMVLYMPEKQTSMQFLYTDMGVISVLSSAGEFPEAAESIRELLKS